MEDRLGRFLDRHLGSLSFVVTWFSTGSLSILYLGNDLKGKLIVLGVCGAFAAVVGWLVAAGFRSARDDSGADNREAARDAEHGREQ